MGREGILTSHRKVSVQIKFLRGLLGVRLRKIEDSMPIQDLTHK